MEEKASGGAKYCFQRISGDMDEWRQCHSRGPLGLAGGSSEGTVTLVIARSEKWLSWCIGKHRK